MPIRSVLKIVVELWMIGYLLWHIVTTAVHRPWVSWISVSWRLYRTVTPGGHGLNLGKQSRGEIADSGGDSQSSILVRATFKNSQSDRGPAWATGVMGMVTRKWRFSVHETLVLCGTHQGLVTLGDSPRTISERWLETSRLSPFDNVDGNSPSPIQHWWVLYGATVCSSGSKFQTKMKKTWDYWISRRDDKTFELPSGELT